MHSLEVRKIHMEVRLDRVYGRRRGGGLWVRRNGFGVMSLRELIAHAGFVLVALLDIRMAHRAVGLDI